MSTYRLALIDVESTGIPDQVDATVIEIGAVVAEVTKEGRSFSARTVATFESLANPGTAALSIPKIEEAFRVNRLTRAMIELAPPDVEVAAAFRRFLLEKRCDAMTSFNRDFDFHSSLLGSRVWKLANFVIPLAPCLMDATAAHCFRGRSRRIGLDDALKGLNLPRVGEPHTALGDALTEVQLLSAVYYHVDIQPLTRTPTHPDLYAKVITYPRSKAWQIECTPRRNNERFCTLPSVSSGQPGTTLPCGCRVLTSTSCPGEHTPAIEFKGVIRKGHVGDGTDFEDDPLNLPYPGHGPDGACEALEIRVGGVSIGSAWKDEGWEEEAKKGVRWRFVVHGEAGQAVTRSGMIDLVTAICDRHGSA